MLKFPVTIHHARLGRTDFKVIRPAGTALAHAVLIEHDWHLDAYVDQEAARRMGGLWELAASSPRALIHLPIRGNPPPTDEVPEECTRRLDLVLLHHSLQFAPSRWKELRGRLDRGRPHTVTLPGTVRPVGSVIGAQARHHRENRDLFHQHLHAETLFMTGSAKVFRETAHHFLDVAREGPQYVPGPPAYRNYCAQLHSNDGVLGRARELHIEYGDKWPA